MSPSTIFVQLIGEWSVSRTVTSFSGSLLARFQGKATFTQREGNPALADYLEEGSLTLTKAGPAESMRSSAKYFYALSEPEEEIAIFRDAELKDLFHKITASVPETSACRVYECGQDIYETKFDFSLLPTKYSMECRASGAGKDYVARSVFERVINPKCPSPSSL